MCRDIIEKAIHTRFSHVNTEKIESEGLPVIFSEDDVCRRTDGLKGPTE